MGCEKCHHRLKICIYVENYWICAVNTTCTMPPYIDLSCKCDEACLADFKVTFNTLAS